MRAAEVGRNAAVSAARLLAAVFLVLALTPALSAAADNENGAPPERDAAIKGGVEWLIANQHADGGWGSHRSQRAMEVFATPPGSHHAFRVATSALCVIALEDSPYRTEASRQAAGRGIDYLLEQYNVKRVSGMEYYTVWAFAYSLQCLGEWLKQHPGDERAEKICAAMTHLIDKTARYQTLDGGWGYLTLGDLETYQPSATSMTFTTAAMVVGIDRAQKAGVSCPDRVMKRAAASIIRSRTPAGSFAYGEDWRMSPAYGINQIKGSACRTPCCQYALMLGGHEVTEDDRRRALDDLLVRHIRFQKVAVRTPIPHESWYQISGYFYLFGTAYAAYVLEGLPAADRKRFSRPLLDAVLFCRQPDGSFWDYPLYDYHKAYGTAFALIALARVEPRGEEAQ